MWGVHIIFFFVKKKKKKSRQRRKKKKKKGSFHRFADHALCTAHGTDVPSTSASHSTFLGEAPSAAHGSCFCLHFSYRKSETQRQVESEGVNTA